MLKQLYFKNDHYIRTKVIIAISMKLGGYGHSHIYNIHKKAKYVGIYITKERAFIIKLNL